MSRIRLVAVLAAISALALAGVATAATKATKATKVTGGSTTLTISTAATKVLSANGLTVTPIAPATASGSTFTFPVAGGRLNAKLRGVVVHRGGFALANATRKVHLRHLTVYSGRDGVSIWAQVGRSIATKCKSAKRCRIIVTYRVAKIARVTGVKISSGSATGTVRLTTVSAGVINALAGKKVSAAGVAIGSATLTPTIS